MDGGIRVDGPPEGVSGSILDLGWLVCHNVLDSSSYAPNTSGLRQVGGGDKLIRRFAVLVVALGVIFGLVLPAAPASAQYIPNQPGCIADPTEIQANVSTPGTLQCIGCPPEVQANAFIIVDGQEVAIGSGQVSDDEDGPVTISVTYPALPAGDYTILVRCGPVLLSNVLTVIGTGGQSAGPLPVTGSNSSMLVQIALLLITIGGLLAVAARKRRHAYD
jgi:LPXTG-motif cell wall-anchored protein